MRSAESLARGQSYIALKLLDQWFWDSNMLGYDKYDFLLTPVIGRVPGALPRRVALQVGGRSPDSVRRLLRTPKSRMAKAVACVTLGHSLVPTLRPEAAGDYARDLLELRLDEAGWGYEFDVSVRWASYDRGTPNIVATAFAIEALHAQNQLDQELRRSLLAWFEEYMISDAGFVRYLPGCDVHVVNGSLLGARALSRLGCEEGTLQRAVDSALQLQRENGSWPYGVGRNLGFVDNFHTEYVLECLTELSLAADVPEVSIRKGISYWLDELFDKDGMPLYFPNRPWEFRRDLHNFASALRGLTILAAADERCELWRHRLALLLTSYLRSDGTLRLSPSEPAFVRWNLGHSFLALCTYVSKPCESLTLDESQS